jgi:transposase
MNDKQPKPRRFVGLDIHKHYLVAVGVDQEQQQVYGPRRVSLAQLAGWVQETLTKSDAVVLEMSANAYQIHDTLVAQVHSVTIVHPPHVALISRAQVKTDRKAALNLAKLHGAGLLPSIWVPGPRERDLRALVAQRRKMVTLATQAKNRLHAVLHRHNLGLPEQGGLFEPQNRVWWLNLPVSRLEQVRLQSDWATLEFAQGQIGLLEAGFQAAAASDERSPLLIQLPGIGLIGTVTVLAAIGQIARFPQAKYLVGYAGLGTRVHDSGQTHRRGGITKAGRSELRNVMIEAAHAACRTHAYWRAELARLEPRLGKAKAIVAIARKLLVIIWHVLTKGCADRFADPDQVARFFLRYAYDLGQHHRPAGQSAPAYVRAQLDRLGLGAELTCVKQGQRTVALPPSCLHNPAA